MQRDYPYPPKIDASSVPAEWWRFANALIARGKIESLWWAYHGKNVRRAPVWLAEELAYAEHEVYESQRAWRILLGMNP